MQIKTINIIEELLRQNPYVIVSDRPLTRRKIVSFSPVKHQDRRRLIPNITYRAVCKRDEVSFISSKTNPHAVADSMANGGSYIPKEYILLNVDLKDPKSIDVIHEFLKQFR